MSNNLKEDITGRYVVLAEGVLSPAYNDVKYRIFHAEGGFGCVPYTSGTAVVGTTPFDGEKFRVEGYEIERFATDEEIALVTDKKDSHG
jgi:hypothetical protein